MHYRLINRNGEHSARTENCRVIKVSVRMEWAIGGHVLQLLTWAASKGYRVYVCERLGAPERKFDSTWLL